MCHGERVTAEVATQHRKSRHSEMLLLPPRRRRTVREAHSGRVPETDRAKKRSGNRNGGMVDPPFTRKKEGERGRGAEALREKEEGEKLESFFGTIFDFLNPVPVIPPVVLPASFVPVTFVPASSPNHSIHSITT